MTEADSVFDGRAVDPAHLRVILRDNQATVLARCPGCGSWAELDDDQLHGRVSTHHDDPACGWHETKDWYAEHTAP